MSRRPVRINVNAKNLEKLYIYTNHDLCLLFFSDIVKTCSLVELREYLLGEREIIMPREEVVYATEN